MSPLTRRLALLVACAVIPILVVSTVLIVRRAAEERRQVERSMLDICRTLAAALDRELLVTVGVLELLAQSSNLASENYAAFHAEASRVVASRPAWQSVLLLTPEGQQLLNTTAPWGTSLGRVNDPASLDEVFRTGKPTVGSLTAGRATGQLAFPVRVPLLRDGKVAMVLTAAVRPASLQDLLVNAFPPRGEWTRGFNDPNGTLAARSRDPERFVGKPGSPAIVQRITTMPEAFYRDTTIDGAEVYTVFSRAPFSRWTAGMSFPAAMVDGPLRRSLILTLGLGLTVTALTGAAAYVVGRRMARPIRAATDAAQALTRGENVPVAASSVREVAVRKRRVLIVDDNADGRAMLRTCLELAGHEIQEAKDGAAAIGAARTGRPDVAIIDIGLPGIDGYEVARQIRAIADGGTRLVALTGYGQPEDRRRAAEAGFDAHITKPVDTAELVALIDALTAAAGGR